MKKDLEDSARDLRELEKDMQASFSGPLVSAAGGYPGDAGLGFPRAQSLLAGSCLSCGVCPSDLPSLHSQQSLKENIHSVQSGAAQLQVSCTRGVHGSPGHPAKHPRGPAVEVVGLICSLGGCYGTLHVLGGCSWGRGREAMDPARHRLPPPEVLGTTSV